MTGAIRAASPAAAPGTPTPSPAEDTGPGRRYADADPAGPTGGRVARRGRAWGHVLSGLAVLATCAAVAVVVLAVSGARAADGETGTVEAAPVAAGTQRAGPAPTSAASRSAGSPVRRVDPTWARRTADATGIPRRALLAYAAADLTITAEQPSCGLSWNTLAAIGEVESSHAREGGATLLESGTTDTPILGPVLDGQGFAAIRDTDDGVWDGHTTWDRAVGPMQFIPSTWRQWAADGNGDGTADPNSIDDAGLAAARYLCASGPVTSPAGWRAAVYSYNHSDAYVDKVAAIANRYAALTPR
ncbi:lytic transglycosylase domain-containing protein [Propionicicella superfundia]|uniref:lytic transglycosylase domain-containing protein n=1 Tax=Propionicicella superfundia TaxID=348582 RepID=UPI0003F89591|nr:lytic transglycosylase domain-containing protein [Propionicicella superfundia]